MDAAWFAAHAEPMTPPSAARAAFTHGRATKLRVRQCGFLRMRTGRGKRDALCLSRGALAEQAVGADLGQLGCHRRLIAAVADVGLEPLERAHLRKRVLCIRGLGDVHEADAVLELEGLVAQAGGLAE